MISSFHFGSARTAASAYTRTFAVLASPGDAANAAEPSPMYSQQRGHLWLRQEWEFHRPLSKGASYSLEAAIREIYPRRDRTILLTESTLRDSHGQVMSRQRHHQSFLLDNPSAGEVAFRDPSTKEGAARALPTIMGELGSIERTVSLEMCGEFFFGAKNYHSDKEQSAALGFPDVVVGGRMTMGYVGELLDATLGERWARTGRLLVKFTNVLWPAETIAVIAGIGGPLVSDTSRQVVLGRVTKSDGTVVLVAEGSVSRD